MKPVHELTPDEAVLQLEQVCDQLLDPDLLPGGHEHRDLLARKAELEAWILMHQTKQASKSKTRTSAEPAEAVVLAEPEPEEPMPAHRKHTTDAEKHQAKLEYQRRYRAKCKENSPKLDMSVGRVKKPFTPELIGPHGEEPPGAPVLPPPAREEDPLDDHSRRIITIRRLRKSLWILMAAIEETDDGDRADLIPDLALLDAAAHAAHQLALGRLEVA